MSRFAWRLDEQPAKLLPATVSGGTASATTALTTLGPGWHTINAQALDAAGNPGPNVVFTFGSKAGLTSPRLGQSTSGWVDLSAVGPNSTGVRFEYQDAAGDWVSIPAADVTSDNSALGGWPAPVTATGGRWQPAGLRWNVAATIAGLYPNPPAGQDSTPLTVRAVFLNGSTTVVDTHDPARPVVVSYDRTGLAVSHATDGFGPGTVDLVTGNLTVSDTDADLDSFGAGLSLSRTFNSTDANRAAGPFGLGWTASISSDDADWTSLTDTGATVTVRDADQVGWLFTRNSTGGYRPAGESAAAQLSLTVGATGTNGPGELVLSDPTGVKISFAPTGAFPSAAGAGTPHTYRVNAVVQPGSADTTSYSYDSAGRPTQVLAPLPTATTLCTTSSWQPGCRALQLNWTGTTVSSAAIRVYDPATSAAKTVLLSCYRYNTDRLVEQWDPRISGATDCASSTGATPTSYGYDSSGRLSLLGQAGLAPTELGYDSSGRASTASQTPTGGTALVSTIRYGVNIGAAAASDDSHPDLTSAAVGRWRRPSRPPPPRPCSGQVMTRTTCGTARCTPWTPSAGRSTQPASRAAGRPVGRSPAATWTPTATPCPA